MSVEFDLPTQEQPLPRLPIAWVLLVVLFSVLIFGAISGEKSPSKVTDLTTFSGIEKSVNLKLSLKSITVATDGKQTPLFEDEIESLLDDSKTKMGAKKLRAVLRIEDKEKPFGDDIKGLLNSKSPADQAFGKLISEEKLDSKQQQEYLKSVGETALADKILKVQTLEKSGDKEVRSKTFSSEAGMKMALVGGMGCFGFLIGSGLWLTYMSIRSTGKWTPKGHVFSGIDPGRADRLILAAVMIIATFVVGQVVAELLSNQGVPFTSLVVVVFLIVAVTFVLKRPIAGYQITAQNLGFKKANIGEDILWGVGAIFANIPVLFLVLMITAGLSKLLPGGTHPASEALLSNHSVSTVLKILFMASVVAPLWEEFVFRGLLFPGISTVAKSPVWGAVASSILFAAIHPQGAVGVLPLAMIGGAMCMIGYQRRSIVSGIVFHSIHNGLTLCAVILISPLLK